jgi:hypothetical protein
MNLSFFKFHLYRFIKSPVFIIQIENGSIQKKLGHIKPGFINDCKEIISRNEIKSGVIYAVRGPHERLILNGTTEIPKDIIQQLRNVWLF